MQYDVAIVGAGMVGLTLAAALAKQTSLNIVILESQASPPAWIESEYYPRVSAIALSSQRIFQSLNVWENMKTKRVSQFTGIQVWDEIGKGAVEFDARDIAESALGFIIENNLIQSSLEKQLSQCPQVKFIRLAQLDHYQEANDGVVLSTVDGQVVRAKLAIAADGAQSWLRQAAGIEMETHAYEQVAMVSTVTTELPHQKIARQLFRTMGPLAFLPLEEATVSSIVWSLPINESQRLMSMSEADFCKELSEAFAFRLGHVVKVGTRHMFPLRRQQAKQYVKSRVVLVGDAAHTMHPLAGQGVNMGLLDAVCLAEVMSDAIKRQQYFGRTSTLRQYERWRRTDNATMMTGVHVIKSLFASDKSSIQLVRSWGLTMTNYMQWLKNLFVRQAVGNRGALPRLAQ